MQSCPKKLSKSLILYSLHVPFLLAVLALVLITSVVTGKSAVNKAQDQEGEVLSSGSGKSGDGDSGSGSSSDDDDDDDDDDNSGSGSSSDDDDDNDDDDEDEDEDEDDEDDDEDDANRGSSGSGSGSSGSGSSGKSKTEVTVTNSDGTVSKIKTEEEDGELKKEIKTYDAKGNKIRVEKYESEEGEEESRVTVYNEAGVKIRDLRFETEDGKELEFRLKEGETELVRVEFDVEKQELIVKSDDSSTAEDDNEDDDSLENKLRIRLDGEHFVLTRQGASVLSKFPLIFDDETGEILVSTPAGEIKLGVMPDTIVQKAQLSDEIDSVGDVVLASSEDETSPQSAPLEFRVTGTKSEKLLGIFTLNLPSEIVYDAEKGEFLRSEQTFVTRILDLFSF